MTARRIAIFILGASALPLARKIKAGVGGDIHGPNGLEGCDRHFDNALHALGQVSRNAQAVVGLFAAGILVRALGPKMPEKFRQPPLIAVAEDGSSVVPLIGGHTGGNDLARRIAEITGGHAAITTASDVVFGGALDEPHGATLANPQHHKPAAAARLRGEAIRLETTIYNIEGNTHHLVYHPHVLAVGIGCERGTDPSDVKALLDETLAQHNIARDSVVAFGSIDVKEDEPAITQFSNAQFFTAAQLKAEAHRVSSPSAIVEAEVGTPSVAEAAALALVGPQGKLLVPKVKSKRATLAIAQAASHEDLEHGEGRLRGLVSVIGIGPGDFAYLTPDADYQLWHATDWVGYSLYLDLVENLRHGQTRHDFPLGDEEARCRKAIELAKQGKQVALVCSGDAAIYAMAALVYELIDREPCRVEVQVHPGISAFQMASARAGAMIGHDFCCISLSDLLTPWEVIEKRLNAAAEGDFVIAFYNPRSLKRRDQLQRAFEILKAHRNADTPVVIASNLGRQEENVRIRKFAEFNPEEVDMLTLVMVGSSQSKAFTRGDGQTYAYTPRGYAKKMSPL
ncbi:MAG: precorrin-3B C(17)-methyltransferase [Alphaproteobacteria bacterium]|nr:precorrin-3B C(17)-methyltransferase [Alphaproteobacteria bacterium]